jgi:hypothetical protein
MTDIPAVSQDRLVAELLTTVRDIACDNGTTRKTLWRAHDGTLLESVLMRYPDRLSATVAAAATSTRGGDRELAAGVTRRPVPARRHHTEADFCRHQNQPRRAAAGDRVAGLRPVRRRAARLGTMTGGGRAVDPAR